MDGTFAPTASPDLDQLWLPHEFIVDIHLMYQRPGDHLQSLVKLMPHMVIVHAEAAADHLQFAAELHRAGILAGLAFLPETSPDKFERELHGFDHVLIFSGNLGHHGGRADLGLLGKATEVIAHHPEVEIGWDGGINTGNAATLTKNGVSVLNVGGFIHGAKDPAAAYATLESLAG